MTHGSNIPEWANQSDEQVWEDAVAAAIEDEQIKQEARRRLRAGTAPASIRKIGINDKLPEPQPYPLIKDILDRGTVVALSGPSGKGKSFTALDWALSVASGVPWMGHAVTRGSVLYVAAEGAHGQAKRVEAWIKVHQPSDTIDMQIVIDPVNLRDPGEVDVLVKMVREEVADLVVIDGLAKCTPGVDESSASEMGEVVDALYRIRDAIDVGETTILVVYHDGYDGIQVQGSSALKAGVDTVYNVFSEDPHDMYSVRCSKRRYGEPPFLFLLRLVQVALDNGTSCVVTEYPDEVAPDVPAETEPTKEIVLIMPPGAAGSPFCRDPEFLAVLNRLEAVTGYSINIEERPS